jgi:hypothetical protein
MRQRIEIAEANLHRIPARKIIAHVASSLSSTRFTYIVPEHASKWQPLP